MLRAALAIREALEQAKVLERIYGGRAFSVLSEGDDNRDVRGQHLHNALLNEVCILLSFFLNFLIVFCVVL